jgi:hypothetical protein
MGGTCGSCVGEERCVHLRWGHLRGKDHFEGLGSRGNILLNGTLRNNMGPCIGLIWTKTGTSGRLL